MIRIATQADEQLLYDFWLRELDYNTFNVGDLAAYGTENHDLQMIWMQLDGEKIIATVLLYKDNVVLYFPKEHAELVDYSGLAACLAGRKVHHISAMDYVWQAFKQYILLEIKEVVPTYLCVLPVAKAKIGNAAAAEIAVADDAAELFVMQQEVFGTVRSERDLLQYQDDIANERIYPAVIRKQGKIVSQAVLTAISPYAAMVVSVATFPEFRQKGYARAALTKLVEVARKRKLQSLVLFYDNPNAGALYHDVGFTTVGQWIMVEV